jgi:hypothetical protein
MYIVLSGVVTFGVPLALAVRELVLLRRGGGGGGGGSWTRDGARETPPAPRPAGNKPLPDCLIPKVQPRCVSRSRVLEDA